MHLIIVSYDRIRWIYAQVYSAPLGRGGGTPAYPFMDTSLIVRYFDAVSPVALERPGDEKYKLT